VKRTLEALKRETNEAGKSLVRKIQSHAPNHIKPHIIYRPRYSGKDKATITVFVKKKKVDSGGRNGTVDALAQEYGSGLHDQRGEHFIPIPKRGKKLMSFYWEKAPEFMKTKKGKHAGKVVLTKVNHPGIMPYRGEGYMGVGFDDWYKSPEGRGAITRGFKTAISTDVKISLEKLIQRYGKK
jgi:hypothetical protein